MNERKRKAAPEAPSTNKTNHSPVVNFRAPRDLYDRCTVLGDQLEAAARRELSPSERYRTLLEAGARVLELGDKSPEQLLVDAGLLRPAPAPRRRA